MVLGWMFLPQSAITSDSNRQTRPIGNLSRRGMCLRVPGGATAKTTISSSRGGKPSSGKPSSTLKERQGKQENSTKPKTNAFVNRRARLLHGGAKKDRPFKK